MRIETPPNDASRRAEPSGLSQTLKFGDLAPFLLAQFLPIFRESYCTSDSTVSVFPFPEFAEHVRVATRVLQAKVLAYRI